MPRQIVRLVLAVLILASLFGGRSLVANIADGAQHVVKPGETLSGIAAQYGLTVDPSGSIAALYRPIHMIGLELGISIASAALRGEPTGCPRGFRADVIATAKRDLAVGEVLDGEGGETVWGSLVPAKTAIADEGLPIGLAHGLALTRPVSAGQRLSLGDVAIDRDEQALRLRQGMLAA